MKTEIAKSQKNKSKLNQSRSIFLTTRDSKILHFIWKWKLASTASIHEAIGRPLSPYSTYKTLDRLSELGYLQATRNEEHKFYSWQLTEKGFHAIRESLGELEEEGYLSENPWHDRNVMAFQLGEWATYPMPGVSHFTEQELRRRPVDLFPSWVPPMKDHRSDGYTQIATAKSPWTLAYEVELWSKSVSRYESIIRFYRMFRQLDRVYWLLGDPNIKGQIVRAKTCLRDDSENFHVFVDLNEYRGKGWDSCVTNERSETLFTIRENMRGMLGDPHGECMGTLRGQSRVTVHYDSFKVLGKSRASRNSQNGDTA